MVLEDVLENVVRGKDEGDADDEGRQGKPQEAVLPVEGADTQERQDQEAQGQEDVQRLDLEEEGPPLGVAFTRLRHPGHPVHPIHMGLDSVLQQPPELGQEGHQGDEPEADAQPRP